MMSYDVILSFFLYPVSEALLDTTVSLSTRGACYRQHLFGEGTKYAKAERC